MVASILLLGGSLRTGGGRLGYLRCLEVLLHLRADAVSGGVGAGLRFGVTSGCRVWVGASKASRLSSRLVSTDVGTGVCSCLMLL